MDVSVFEIEIIILPATLTRMIVPCVALFRVLSRCGDADRDADIYRKHSLLGKRGVTVQTVAPLKISNFLYSLRPLRFIAFFALQKSIAKNAKLLYCRSSKTLIISPNKIKIQSTSIHQFIIYLPAHPLLF